MKNFKCAIFDLDGTVLDSLGVWGQVDIDFFAERNIPLPDDYAKTISPMGFERAAEYTIERFNLKETKQQVMAEWNEMAQRLFATSVGLKKGVGEYLEYLKEKDVSICIATASHEELFVPALKNNGIFEFFSSFTTLREVSRGKGFPDVYLKSCEKLGFTSNESVVFEDLYEGIRGAKNGGFYTVAVHDKASEKDKEKISEIADKYIYDFRELIY